MQSVRLAAHGGAFGNVIITEIPAAERYDSRNARWGGHAHAKAFSNHGIQIIEVLEIEGQRRVSRIRSRDLFTQALISNTL